jgi:hypothetical protein
MCIKPALRPQSILRPKGAMDTPEMSFSLGILSRFSRFKCAVEMAILIDFGNSQLQTRPVNQQVRWLCQQGAQAHENYF